MLTNNTGIPISVAAWLATDNYDYQKDDDSLYISATALLRPMKSIILGHTTPTKVEQDLVDLVPSRLGTAVHDRIEAAWHSSKLPYALKKLGYAEDLIQNIVINPKNVSDIALEDIPIFMEIRGYRNLDGWKVGGKFDFVMNGLLTDFKTTKTYSWISGTNVEAYTLQGSIYRWLHPTIITEDEIEIAYLFTDWIQQRALQDKAYPQYPIIAKRYPLLSLADTEEFIHNKLTQINTYLAAYKNSEVFSQATLPVCTKEELWQNDPVFKYFKDPAKRTRSTKNFDNLADANARLAADGGKGVVVTVPGEVKRCRYCDAQPVCLQAEQLKIAGLLK